MAAIERHCEDGCMRTNERAALAPDPLYDAPYLVFIYSGWVVASWAGGDLAGLAVLVVSTLVLTAVAGNQEHSGAPQSFAADFAVILLFCAAAIGAGVFIIRGLSGQPELTLAAVAAALASTSIMSLTRPEPEH